MKMHPVVHFEIPADDRKRACDFYGKVFGWQTKQLGQEMGNYVLVTTTESDEQGPIRRAAINGGLYQKQAGKPMQYPSVVIPVEDIKEHMMIVEKAGGKILGEPWDIPGYGIYVSFLDSEGNRIGMMQPIIGM